MPSVGPGQSRSDSAEPWGFLLGYTSGVCPDPGFLQCAVPTSRSLQNQPNGDGGSEAGFFYLPPAAVPPGVCA